MEHVVYLLGAGFSAPLGLPVVANFLLMAKDLYFGDRQRYQHFAQVFSEIANLSRIKNVLNADLYDIEEILSILQMQDHLGSKSRESEFTQLIRDVIEAYRPALVRPQHASYWYDDFLGGRDCQWQPYAQFVAHLFNLHVRVPQAPNALLSLTQDQTPKFTYDLISLNYDQVCEKVATYFQELGHTGAWLSFRRSKDDQELMASFRRPLLAKLHGTVDGQTIVPPTWSKALSLAVVDQWQAAQAALRKANHVRVLGYSLPTGDSYFRYFLKSALVEAEHLKTFDVLCLDHDDSVHQRWAGSCPSGTHASCPPTSGTISPRPLISAPSFPPAI